MRLRVYVSAQVRRLLYPRRVVDWNLVPSAGPNRPLRLPCFGVPMASPLPRPLCPTLGLGWGGRDLYLPPRGSGPSIRGPRRPSPSSRRGLRGPFCVGPPVEHRYLSGAATVGLRRSWRVFPPWVLGQRCQCGGPGRTGGETGDDPFQRTTDVNGRDPWKEGKSPRSGRFGFLVASRAGVGANRVPETPVQRLTNEVLRERILHPCFTCTGGVPSIHCTVSYLPNDDGSSGSDVRTVHRSGGRQTSYALSLCQDRVESGVPPRVPPRVEGGGGRVHLVSVDSRLGCRPSPSRQVRRP